MKDTGTARLPALPAVSTGNVSLDNWIRAVSERLEVREGARGNPAERVVTQRELTAMGLGSAQWTTDSTSIGGVMVQLPGGGFSRVPLDTFTDEIRKTKLYADLVRKIDDVTRFDDVPEQVRSILLQSLADEASKRGAEIRRVESVIQTATESLAYSIQDITAGLDGAVAGVRDATYAAASQGYATAGKVTTVTARLDNFSDGTAGVATVETKATATVSRTTGLEAQYTVKVSTGGAVAGFGLASTAATNTTPSSSFIIQADKFAVVSSTYAGGLTNAPAVATVPFGVDATGVYIKGTLRIDTGGKTGASLITEVAAAATTAVYGNLTGTPSSTIANSSVTLSAAGALSGAGGGTVTIGGLGYTGALDATKNQTDATTNGAISTAQTTANTASSNASSAVTTANSASSAASTAQTTANTGVTNAAAAQTTANSATTALAGKLSKSGADTMVGPISLSTNNAILVGTVNDGLYLGNAGLVGRKGSATTFSIAADGTATFAGALSAATGSFAGSLSAATGSFAGSLSAATGTFTGNITGAASVNITGQGRFLGSATTGVADYALAANVNAAGVFGSAPRGIYGAANSPIGIGMGVRGDVYAVTPYGGCGVFGYHYGNSTAGAGVVGESNSGYGVHAQSQSNIALYAQGKILVDGQVTSTLAAGTAPFAVTSTTVNTNLNAQLWNGLSWTTAGAGGQAVTLSAKPGTTGGACSWLVLTLTGTNYYVPLWTA